MDGRQGHEVLPTAPPFPDDRQHAEGLHVADAVIEAVWRVHIATPELIGQSQVNADFRIPSENAGLFDLALEVDVPPATGILREAAGFDGAVDGARLPETAVPC